MKTLVADSTDSNKPTIGSRILILDIRMGFEAMFLLNVSQPFNKAPMSGLKERPHSWLEKREYSATALSTVIIMGGK